ncbi:hypothetical protein [Ideonella sp.]|uniref:hypothetical protein n=1 Tax=Ideonella sp. TaxID=1929293 RepID=UPI0035AF1652
MNDYMAWMWPLLAVAVGLALGMMLGAARRRGRRGNPHTDEADALPSQPGGDMAGRDASPQQRLLERLRAANLQLSAQLKSLAEAHSRQQQEREQERQAERLRQEQALEELRQAHTGELSQLMKTMVEQVDRLNKAHSDQLKALETELERYRQDSRRSSGPGALGGGTRPVPIHAPATPVPGPASTRGGALPSDYSVTLPMESFKDEPPRR